MKKIMSLAVCLCILLCTFAVCANEPPHEISWNITDGTLTVSGSGAIPDYRNEADSPWYSRKSEISKIVVEDGITHIGNLAFYGLTNAKEATIADSVESVGLCAFGYTDLTKTSIGDLSAPYQFKVESDSAVVSEGDEFTVSINLTADFKDLAGVQSILLFDRERIAIDEEKWYDEEWLNSIDETNLGYISKPLSGFVANNLRLMYISMGGTKIDADSPLYNQGTTTLTIAKVKCTALKDIEDINTSCFAIKSSAVFVVEDGESLTPASAETQLTTTVRLPIKGLVINGEEIAAVVPETDAKKETEEAAQEKAEEKIDMTVPVYDTLTVVADGKIVAYDVMPYENENGILMLPLRHTLEGMNATVTWDNDTRSAFTIYNGELVAVQIDRNLMFKNDTTFELSTAAVIKDTRTMVPVDFIENAFDFDVQYNKASNLITISKK